MASTHTRYNFAIIFFVALGSFTYGFNSAIMGSAYGLSSFIDYFKLDAVGSNTSRANALLGATNGLYTGGGVIGCLFVPTLLDAFGRKRTIQITTVLCVLSAALQTGSVHIAMLLVARFLNGIGVGMINVTVPIYQSEISPAKMRGRMVGSHGFLLCVGYSLAAWAGYGCYFIKDHVLQWRLCLAFQMIAPLLLLIGSPWVPESPRWLCAKDKTHAAFEILRKLHPGVNHTDDSFAQAELDSICRQVRIDAAQLSRPGWRGVLSKPSCRKRLFFGFFVQLMAQSTGVLVINNYQVLLYNGLGITGSLPLMLYAWFESYAAILNYFNSLLLDRLGRIRILITGLIGCSLSLCVYSALFAQFGGTNNKIGNGFGVAFIFVFVTFYGGSMDASSYVYCSEIFPTAIRARGVGVSVAGLFLGALTYTVPAPTAFAAIGWKYYLIFIFIPWIGAGVMYKYFPETARLSLEEIGGLFGDEVVHEHLPGDVEGKVSRPGSVEGGELPPSGKDSVQCLEQP